VLEKDVYRQLVSVWLFLLHYYG